MNQDLISRVDRHEAADQARFAALAQRLEGVERKVAVGSFLGVVAAEAIGRGIPGVLEALPSLLAGAQALLASAAAVVG